MVDGPRHGSIRPLRRPFTEGGTEGMAQGDSMSSCLLLASIDACATSHLGVTLN